MTKRGDDAWAAHGGKQTDDPHKLGAVSSVGADEKAEPLFPSSRLAAEIVFPNTKAPFDPLLMMVLLSSWQLPQITPAPRLPSMMFPVARPPGMARPIVPF
jgi:hypothetical protein